MSSRVGCIKIRMPASALLEKALGSRSRRLRDPRAWRALIFRGVVGECSGGRPRCYNSPQCGQWPFQCRLLYVASLPGLLRGVCCERDERVKLFVPLVERDEYLLVLRRSYCLLYLSVIRRL